MEEITETSELAVLEVTPTKGTIAATLLLDEKIVYEEKRWLYELALFPMWLLTIWVAFKKGVATLLRRKLKINTFWVDGLSASCRQVKEGAASWRALDVIYNYKGNKDRLTNFWMRIRNAQAVRNRTILVRPELKKAIMVVTQKEPEIRLLSIASGSAQVVIKVIAELVETVNIKAIFLDLDKSAIEYSKRLAREYDIEETISFCNDSTSNLEKLTADFHPNVIEMIGFLDYRSDKKAIELVNRIYKILLPGGKFITANTAPNPEQYFMKYVVNWPMIYRTPKKLSRILTEGGFKRHYILSEPHKIHNIAICEKPV